MTRTAYWCFPAFAVLALDVRGVAAHHSFAAFDRDRNVVITGTPAKLE